MISGPEVEITSEMRKKKRDLTKKEPFAFLSYPEQSDIVQPPSVDAHRNAICTQTQQHARQLEQR
mgnify:CR=1 FL=1